jgi:hypothetical protein
MSFQFVCATTPTVLICGKVFDGLSEQLQGPAEIVIEGNRIMRVQAMAICAAFMTLEAGSFVVPTMQMTQEDLHELQAGTLPCQAVWKFRRDSDKILASQRLLAGSNVKVAYGTDCGMFPFSHGILEFQAMVKAGLSPVRALKAATSVAAELLGRDDLGRIAPGKLADIVAMPGDPSQRSIIGVGILPWMRQGIERLARQNIVFEFATTPRQRRVSIPRYRQELFPASPKARKVMVVGNKVMAPAAALTPARLGRSSLAPSASSVPFNCTRFPSRRSDDKV